MVQRPVNFRKDDQHDDIAVHYLTLLLKMERPKNGRCHKDMLWEKISSIYSED